MEELEVIMTETQVVLIKRRLSGDHIFKIEINEVK